MKQPDASGRFANLLAPLRVGGHELKNRVVMGSMHTRLEQAPDSLARRVAFYSERARGGVALIVTAGYSPNEQGKLEPDGQTLQHADQLSEHRPVTEAVHAAGAKIILQILHAGRYAKHDLLVGPSPTPSPINKRIPHALSEEEIDRTLEDFAHTAELAMLAGYDGIEVMGSEGYLLNQFLCLRANRRADAWGGTLQNRCRFVSDLVHRVRARIGQGALLSYRASLLDLVEDGLTGVEIDYVAREVEAAGADMIATGIGWHESRVPTIAYHVPRGAWRFATARLKRTVNIPVVASNRINTAELAEDVLANTEADLVSLARPLLADPEFANKVASGRTAEINTCIACNQACLDYIFSERSASCLVNPRAGLELQSHTTPAAKALRIAIVGAGPAGIACAIQAAQRGHRVTLFESDSRIGGQLNLAVRIPGKSEFHELLRYFAVQLELHQVGVRTGCRIASGDLTGGNFDHVVIATGSRPREIDIPCDASVTAGYADVIRGDWPVGNRVAIIGTGGIGHDVAEFLTTEPRAQSVESFFSEWGVDNTLSAAGGLAPLQPLPSVRQVSMFQRSHTRPGSRLGVSTGWIVRRKLQRRAVNITAGCEYLRIDRRGLHYLIEGRPQVASVDTVVVCAGQEPEHNTLSAAMSAARQPFSVIGGARLATELDATRAITEGTQLAQTL
jgi:2,4-dienoyl-CoA reductase (NADPH2)